MAWRDPYDDENSVPQRRDWRSSVKEKSGNEKTSAQEIVSLGLMALVGFIVMALGPCRPIAEPVYRYLTKPKTPSE